MGRPPAYIFVVRHGNRLDAADKQWHLSSPTPYDPPLTYGGWIHSRNVGARIAAILRDAPEPPSSSSLSSSPPASTPKRRRFRVVLHSSPFLRCVQTSIAISAGLAANPASLPASTNHTEPRSAAVGLAQASASGNPTPPLASASAPSNRGGHVGKPVLRLDPFLGEWLSPEYFEHITPPPESALMLATAKAELLRRSSYHDYPHFHHRVHSSATSHLWGNISGHSHDGDLGTPAGHGIHGSSVTDSPSHMVNGNSSHEGHSNGPSDHTGGRRASHDHQAHGYVFPVPSYALSTSEPIPRGYVAHARDACVSIDYQWDSSRDTLDWGDGGTLPEEWAAMHQRFRKGLRRLIDWYGSTENAGLMVTRTAHLSRSPDPDSAADGDEDDEIEDVVVLVSHGAGCNALIGAITQQPVLADIAMSSLTMAERRADFDPQNISLARQHSVSSLLTALPMSRATMPEMYELKLFANSDHLVTPSTPTLKHATSPSILNTGSRFGSSGYTSALKEINFGSLYGSSSGNGRDESANASLGSMRRPPGRQTLVMQPPVYSPTSGGVTVGSGMSSFSVTRPDRSGSGTWGLWSPRQDDADQDEEPESPMFLNFSHEKPTKTKKANYTTQKVDSPVSLIDTDKLAFATTGLTLDGKRASDAYSHEEAVVDQDDEEHDQFDRDAVRHLWGGTGNGALWGAPRPPGEAELMRDFSSHKRRWTVTER